MEFICMIAYHITLMPLYNSYCNRITKILRSKLDSKKLPVLSKKLQRGPRGLNCVYRSQSFYPHNPNEELTNL